MVGTGGPLGGCIGGLTIDIIISGLQTLSNGQATPSGSLKAWSDLALGKDYYIDRQNTRLILKKNPLGEGSKVPNYTLGWVFWIMIFYNLKKFTSRSI